MALKLNTQVRQVLPAPIQGTVNDVFYDPAVEKLRYLVAFSDANGAQERWFWEDEIEVTEGGAQ